MMVMMRAVMLLAHTEGVMMTEEILEYHTICFL